jgi:hypothetical protein
MRTLPVLPLVALSALSLASADPVHSAPEHAYLGDQPAGIRLEHRQQWGDFGFNRAAARSGGTGSPLRIGTQTYLRGLGHHANGEIEIELRGRFLRFKALAGIQWQGGNRGSVVFRVTVDGETRFETGPMSDSDPPRPIDVALDGARKLRLIAADAGDGIGCDMANWVDAFLLRDPKAPSFGVGKLTFDGQPAPPPSATSTGFALVARNTGPQAAVMDTAGTLTVAVDHDEVVQWTLPVRNTAGPIRVRFEATVVGDRAARVALVSASRRISFRTVERGERVVLETELPATRTDAAVVAATRGAGGATGVRLSNLRYVLDGCEFPLSPGLHPGTEEIPPPVLPDMRPVIEQELIQWDWRMQDGIGTPRERRTWRQATEKVIQSGDRLVRHLALTGGLPNDLTALWESLCDDFRDMRREAAGDESGCEHLWLRAHALRRRIALANPAADVGPLLFVKHVPSGFSHQLTQYGGRRARPGGGVFVLETPGRSMRCRRLDTLPSGSFLHADVSWDGRRVLFAYCGFGPPAGTDRHYRLYEVGADGSDLVQLTDGPYDDFSPRYLPDGRILFVSTRRGGFHRCGRGPCPVYTMAVANADGSDPRVISFHETHEWDPAVLHDGRIIYTRWDYVDRHAVHYQQLWSVRPDGSDVRAFYGNNTLNPVGVWEARPIPGSLRVMATAAAHHAMTAGSIISLDVTRGVDGLAPITRLTPDALFPESEAPVQHWHARAGVPVPPELPEGQRRWPGHTYRSPCPLSEDVFLAAYSFDPLLGEPLANRANMYGIYLVDRFGNKELLYRDVGICSLWPMPLAPRRRPPIVPSQLREDGREDGTFLLQDVYASWPPIPGARGTVKALRILQVLPKTTPHANTPRLGLANASPGKQVLGTVPVEADGSAYFRAPAGIPLSFQALDEDGMAIQTMRSLTYLQRGERAGCVGCHEYRTTAPRLNAIPLAGRREPSDIAPGPDGSKPFNYAILVQPVLDRRCVRCHGGDKTDGDVDLTGVADGAFTRSYKALAPLVAYSEWKGTPQANHEPLTQPNRFGARASRLTRLLAKGHEGVKLSDDEQNCLVTWMDANALFYGTFDPQDQRRQQRGERIAGPALE